MLKLRSPCGGAKLVRRTICNVISDFVFSEKEKVLPIFEDGDDFPAFERILFQAVERTGTDLLAICLMRNH